ncbi:hypothetical protein EWF20_13615 [Sulfolobus sp. S-194]|uniref:hypothetical protein n=1 Tax=Sulfolobus sp. S-194 TaxID=2512240 RepID=UPI00143732AD|nr:hypothetical protein [Sulfolobus sp. S-194]QIW25068.1 hypothetical protein EWF20_13615 [Sulfolobus sp. S-194]
MSILINDAKELTKKIIIMIINGVLSFYITLHFTNLNFAYITLGLVFAISFLIENILLPVLIILSIIISNLNLLEEIINGIISFPNLEKIAFLLVFLFIIPLIHLAIRRNPRSFITAGNLFLQNFNPTIASILYYSGVSFNESYLDGIFSFLPFIYLLTVNFNNHVILVSVILILIGSVLYSINSKFYSVVGIIPITISAYYFSILFNSPYFFYGIILSLAINIIDRVINFTKTINENREATANLKNRINEEIKNIQAVLYSLRSEIGKEGGDLIKIIDGTFSSISNIQNKLNECKNINCLSEINDELLSQKRILTIEINNLIFDKIRGYNDFTLKLKKIGINLSEIEYPKEEIKLEEFIDFYRHLKQTIETNIILATNFLNAFVENTSKTIGVNLDKLNIINMNYISERLNNMDVQLLNKKLDLCVSKALEVIQLFTEEESYEIKKSLADIPLQPFTINKVGNAAKLLEKINNFLLVDLIELQNTLKTISSIYKSAEIDNMISLINIEIQTLQTPEMPYCEKISRLYSSISELKEAIELASNKDTLTQLSELVDTLLPQILETGEINLNDIGINENYANFIIALLNKKGFKAEINGNKIRVGINTKE